MRLLALLLMLPSLVSGASLSSEAEALLADADIAILGEVHDNAAHHRMQAELLEALAPAAVVFEMLTPAQANTVNSLEDRDQALREALAWDEGGWPDWPLYQPVFAALGDAAVYGMALPRSEVSRAVSEGAAPVFGDEAAQFGLARPLPQDQQREREEHQQAAHCNALPEELTAGMVEAQRLRDAAFARTALVAFRETRGRVAVITGSGHARTDWGMPAALKHAAPAIHVVALGQLEAEPEGEPPYDIWLVTEAAPREDPCAEFSM